MIEIMDDRELEKMIKTVDIEVVPPEGLKEKLLARVRDVDDKTGSIMTPFERFIFEKPLRTACSISFTISGLLWAIMGSGLTKLLIGMIG